ncbi:hypothetical protein GCWU000322_00063 [Eubacterium saphenum ATCC 49989]|nr:hypothetical protein GCWU000322_00063 [Eubacterium saphenum ATCC 49989]
MEEAFPDKSSAYAEEGALAHGYAEKVLKKALKGDIPIRLLGRMEEEMRDAVMDYVQKCLDISTDLGESRTDDNIGTVAVAVEGTVSIPCIPEGFGTIDFAAHNNETQAIVDFKYGKGNKVYAKGNPQLMLYASGCLADLPSIKNVRLIIVQPRLEHIDVAEYTRAEIEEFEAKIKPIAEKAFRGEGDFVSGEHCKFCSAKAVCTTHAKDIATTEPKMIAPKELTTDEVAELIPRAELIADWLAAAKQYLLGECLAGREVKGYKAVEGRAIRVWSDQDKALELLEQAGYDKALIYESAPLSLAKLEKMVGKKEFGELVGEYITRKTGKPTLAPEDDKRPALKSKAEVAFLEK